MSEIERVVSRSENAGLGAEFADAHQAFLIVYEQWSRVQEQARQLSDCASQAAIDTTTLMTELANAKKALAFEIAEKKNIQEQLEQFSAVCEQRVSERTAALVQSNQVLQDELALRAKAEQSLRHDALHDPLTSLPNRNLLTQRLTQFVDRSARYPEFTFAVLFLDLDNFKWVNDTHGHSVGDELLLAVADRLRTCLRSLDTVGRGSIDTTARLGGDEFIILLDDLNDAGDVVIIAERILKCLAEPYHVGGQDLCIGASVGIAIGGREHVSADKLISQADTAMYRAKQAGRGRYAIFNENMHRAAMQRLVLENDLRAAAANGQLRIQYQPIVSLDEGETTGFEALLRWERPGMGVIEPDDFLPIAEESGLIVDFGKWVIEKACAQLRVWNDLRGDLPPLSININVSRRQIAESEFVEFMIAAIQAAGVDPTCVNLEFIEGVLLGASDSVIDRLKQLRAFGVKLQMDDFGTGYSSINSLHRLPLDVVKIDESVVGHTTYDRQYTAIIHAIISLAKNLGLRVSAEGLESGDQLAQAIALDCDLGQGYLFSKPLDPKEATELIQSNPNWCDRLGRFTQNKFDVDRPLRKPPNAVID